MATTLSGNLDTFSLADLLQWLEINGLSGRVSIHRGDVRRTIDLAGGQIVFVSSSRPDERLGTFLVGRGILPEAEVYELLAENFVSGRNLTRLVLSRQLLTREQLAEAVEALATQVLLDLFHWSGAAFEYDPSFVTEDLLNIQLSLRGQVLAIHGAKSVDDTARIKISFAQDEDFDVRWAKAFEPDAVAMTFWGLLEGLPAETPGVSIRDRYFVFSRFAAKVKAAIEAPFRPLPPYADSVELLRAALRDDFDVDHVVRIAALDPFLTVDFLYLANSLRPRRSALVATASQAVAAIGVPALRRYVTLLTDPSGPSPSRDRLDRLVRRAAVSTAVAASHVATATHQDAELAYTLGLLEPLGSHELLKLLLTEDFEPGPFRVAALAQFRALHGGILARKLNLPRPFADVLGSSGNVSSQDPEAEQTVFLARQLSPADQIGREWTSEDPELADRYAALAVDSELPARIARDVAGVRELLNL